LAQNQVGDTGFYLVFRNGKPDTVIRHYPTTIFFISSEYQCFVLIL